MVAATLLELMDVGGIEGGLAVQPDHPVVCQGTRVIVSRKHPYGEFGVALTLGLPGRYKAADINCNYVVGWNWERDKAVKLGPFLRLKVFCD